MTIAVRLSDQLISEARKQSSISFRSLSKQIEYWAFLGKMADQNPDLPVSFIKGCIDGKSELENCELSKFEFID